MASQGFYEVVITKPARDRFQFEILDYIQKNFSLARTFEIEKEIMSLVLSLQTNPQRGSMERWLKGKNQTFRFLLLKKTKYLEIKVIYYIDELEKKVLVTDFFLTKMNPSKMRFS